MKVVICTPAKVGTGSFLHTLKEKYETIHTHSLLSLKKYLLEKNNIIITGFRDPIARNLSYFFQTHENDYYNDFKTKYNHYEGEYCYVGKLPNSVKKVINIFKENTNHISYNQWIKEFLEITKINIKEFNKEKGLMVYKLPNNNTLIVYTLEKLNNNLNEICEILDVDSINIHNENKKNLYKKVKSQIKYDKEHLKKLIYTKELKFFYDLKDLDKMYNNYKCLPTNKSLIKNIINL